MTRLYIVFLFLMAITLPWGYGIGNPMIDTPSYISAWDKLLSGSLDKFRTPIYPAVLGVVRGLTGEQYMFFWVAVLQFAVFGLSIRYFYRTVAMLVPSRRITFYTTLFYILSPTTYLWCRTPLSESLSISLVVFWVYCLVSLMQGKYTWRLLAGSMFTLSLLYLIRPAFVYLLGVSAVACVIYCLGKNHLHRKLAFLTAQLVPALVLMSYCFMFKAQYGVFSQSSVATFNQLVAMKREGKTELPTVTSPELRRDLEYYTSSNSYDIQGDFNALCDKYGLAAINEAVKKERITNLLETASSCILHFNLMVHSDDTSVYAKVIPPDDLLMLLSIRGKDMLVILFVFALYTLWHIARRQRPWISLIFVLAIAANIATALVAAQDEWMRLSVLSAPLMMYALAIMVGNLTCRKGYSPA